MGATFVILKMAPLLAIIWKTEFEAGLFCEGS
jgi:hypothetical protein